MTSNSPLPPTTEISRNRVMLAVALVSCASLLLELALTRLFSVVLFYHFAFLAISVALLGLGAGGVFAYVRRQKLERWSTPNFGFLCSLAGAASILIALQVVLRLPISLDLTWWNFGKLSLMYLVCAVPFFFTGLIFSVVFAREASGIGKVYGSDLLGGALACMAVVPLLNWIGGPNAIVASAVLMATAAIIWTSNKTNRIQAIAATLLLALLIGANYSGKLIDIVYAKGVRRDQPWMLFAQWNAISRIEVDQVGGARYIVIDADASTAIMNVDPKKWEQPTSQPHDGVNLIPHTQDQNEAYNWKKDLMAAAPSIANVLRPQGKFAIIGPGGGVDVLRAVANGSKDVTGIEINPIIADTIMRGNHAEYSHNLYNRPEVRIAVGDGRSFIRNSKEKYDVIQMTLVDTWASTAAGAFALSENNLYTVEAFEEYFQHLKPDGFIAITRWEFKEPREALRVVSQGIEALRRLGLSKNFVGHFIVISDGELDVDGRPVVVLAKRTPFNDDEILRVRYHVSGNPNLHLLFFPSIGSDDPGKGLIHRALHYPMGADKWAFLDRIYQESFSAGCEPSIAECDTPKPCEYYKYDVCPVYDKNPFFFFTLKTGHVFKNILAGTGRGMDWRINLGVTVLFMVFAISIVAVIAFLILPLWLAKLPTPSGFSPKVSLLYFVAVGLGFILVEIALIQRFVLFLGHPTYALTVVIFLMLLSSGLGSFAARRWLTHPSRVWLPLLLIAAGVCAYLYVLPVVLSAMIGAAFPLKVLISGLLIIPLGFIMGMPFPTGLRAMSELNDQRIEWAWAMNAAASVLGSVSAMIIAIHFGLNVALLCGAAAYVFAAGMSRAFRNA